MRILYIGRFQLPNKDAASLRVYNIGQTLKKSGHNVDYLCLESYGSEPIVWEDSTYYFAFSKGPSGIEKNREWLFGKRSIQQFKEMCRLQRYDAVILYNTTFHIEESLIKYCRSQQIRVIGDVTEWYMLRFPKTKNEFLSFLHAFAVDRRIRKADQKLDGVIAISKYLFDYYSNKGLNVLRVPPIFHYDRCYKDPNNKYRTILYAGSPAKKDEIYILIDALKVVNKDRILLNMVFIGADRTDTDENLEKFGIYFKPKCTNAQVLDYVQNSDFTVLLRRNKRFAKAGYSTKVAESLFNGVPVFCNEVGGTDSDIENGINGIKIKELSLKAVCDGLIEIAQLSQEECRNMRRDCRLFGESFYEAALYIEPLNSFLHKCFDS